MDTETVKRLQEKLPETLYGQITYEGKVKIGQFRYQYNKWSGRFDYHYYTPKGYRGKGGFTPNRARILYVNGQLSTNPEHGKPENYI
jgi:hypothetical protein